MFSAITVSDQSGYCAVAEEAELGEEVEGHDDDREPACPALRGEESEPADNEQHAPDQHDPAPAGQVDDEEARTSDDVVLVIE